MPSSSAASMHSNAMHSIGNQIGYKVRNMAHHGQPTIEINLDNTHGKWVTSYATMDTIEGNATITASHDTRFEHVDISLIGTCQVYVDRLTTTPSMSGRTEATHRFLTLKQPIDDNDLPCPRKLQAGKQYTFPFTFTVPAQLLPRACPHRVSNDFVKESHLMLPPSMGDAELAGFGGTLLDDLAPEMAKITYGIKVRLTQTREADGAELLLVDKMRKIRVKPAYEEQPPLNIDPSDLEYRLRQEKVIKKGLFKGKLGVMTAQSVQPKALMIPGARTSDNRPITTKAKILLRFDPADENHKPPKLGCLASRIKASTYYASAPRPSVPTRSSLGFDLTQGLYQENICLSSLCIASAQWAKRPADENPSPTTDTDNQLRRDSGISDCSTTSANNAFNAGIPTASTNYKGTSFYTAQIVVPITLPTNKNFLPTFHSCLVSRVYVLSFTLTVHATGVTAPSLHIKVPIQVAAEGSDAGNANARARRAESVVALETEDIFTPRSVAPPSASSRDNDLPPQYAVFASNGTGYQARVTVVG